MPCGVLLPGLVQYCLQHSYVIAVQLLLQSAKWFQVLLYNGHNLTSFICLHTVCSIWSIDRILSGATTPRQRGLGRRGNEEVLHIPQISKTDALSSDGLTSYPLHLIREGLTPLQRSSQCVLLLKLTGLRRIVGFIPFPTILVLCEMQTALSRFWTQVAESISYDQNHYTMSTSNIVMMVDIDILRKYANASIMMMMMMG